MSPLSILSSYNAVPNQKVIVNLKDGLTTYKVKTVSNKGVTLVISKVQIKNGETCFGIITKETPKQIKVMFNVNNEGKAFSGLAAGECQYKNYPIYIV